MHTFARGRARTRTAVLTRAQAAAGLLLWLLAALYVAGGPPAQAQVAVTAISDTVYYANGAAAAGKVLISWSSFTTATGISVPAGSTSVTLDGSGRLQVSLAPNAGATPAGSYYTVVYHLNDGSTSREYWTVPANSGTTVSLAALRTGVLPTSVAVQTVSKQYVDQAIAKAALGSGTSATGDGSAYVVKTGDTMTGPLLLPGDPVSALQAADKSYVDTLIAGLQAGLAQKVSLTPSATQTVTQPAGTQLQVNNLNGQLYAKEYLSQQGNDGVARAVGSVDCANGCAVVQDPTYVGTDTLPLTTSKTRLADQRGGAVDETYFNPQSPHQLFSQGRSFTNNTTMTAAANAQSGHSAIQSSAVQLTENALAGGNNVFPQTFTQAIPYFKSTYSASNMNGLNYTQGQHVLDNHQQDCYGIGDCLVGSQFLFSSGGNRDNSDEGTHPFDIQIAEHATVFRGTCGSGCSTGSTQLQVTATNDGGTQGEGRFLIDKNPSKTITVGTLTGGVTSGALPTAQFSGTAFPVSTFFNLAAAALPQSTVMAPGTVNALIQTSGVPAGYSTNTAAAPAASGVACVVDVIPGADDFEMVNYTVTDGTHLRLQLLKPHSAGATIAMGGLCGYGLEQTVDTANNIRQVFPVVGSTTGTSLYYAGLGTRIVGLTGQTGGYANIQLTLTNLQRSGNTVTATASGTFPQDINGLSMTVAGAADPSYNGTFTVTTTAANQFTYAQTGANSTSTGGTASIVTGGYVLYPMAEVLSVYNTATRAVDGFMSLAPNTVAWAAGDPVEEPHYFQNRMAADTTYVKQFQPRSTQPFNAGLQFDGVNSSFMNGWSVYNNTPVSSYFGNGGTHAVPNAAFMVQGPWTTSMDMQAGDSNGLLVRCNSHGCGKWNSAYNLFALQSSQYYDYLNFAPNTSTMTFNMRGTQYSISPTALTAGTINATTINATRINGLQTATASTVGGVTLGARATSAVLSNVASSGDAGDLTTGTVAAARLGNVPNMMNPVPVPAGGGEYAFTEGSGTTVNDLSGNGNTLELCSGANAPTWYAYGLAFLDTGQPQPTFNCVTTPFTSYGTVYFATITPNQLQTTGTQATYGLPASNGGIFMGFSAYAGSGMNLQTQVGINAFQPSTFSSAGNTTAADGFGGAHVYSFSAGTGNGSLDRWTVDGVEPAYLQQVASAAAVPIAGGGVYQVGTALNSPDYHWRGVATYMIVYPGQHTAAQQLAVSRYIQAKLAGRGSMPVAVHNTSRAAQFIASGDSLTSSQAGTAQWTTALTLDNPYNITDNGIAGITAFDICKLGEQQWGKYIVPGRTVVHFWAGTNDLAVTSRSASDAWTSLVSCGLQAKRAGARTVVATMIDRQDSGSNMVAGKNALNALIRSGWKTSGAFDALNDLAEVPALGADGAGTNTSTTNGCFYTDKVHLVGPGAGTCATMFVNGNAAALSGYGLVAQLTSNAVNTLDGSSQSNPDMSASNSFVESYANNVVVQTPTAAATHALVDCQGQASPRTLVNGSTSFAITVSGVNGQGITGNATVAPSTTGVFQPVLTSAGGGGCSWLRMQ